MSNRNLPKNYRSKLRRPEPGEQRYREPPAISIREKDLDILKLLFEHRHLTSEQIYKLSPEKKGWLKKRLHQLWLNGYLDRPEEQQVLRVRDGMRYLLYSLGEKGLQVLARRRGYRRKDLRWTKDEVGFSHLRHSLFVSRFFACLKLALKEQEGAELGVWRQGKSIRFRLEKRPYYLEERESRADRPRLQPDALFSLLGEGKDDFFFLEADRSTVREKSMLARYKKYYGCYEQGEFAEKGLPEDPSVKVLTVCKNRTRARNLRQLVEQNSPWNGKSSMYWFAKERWSLEEPGPILEKNWRTSRVEDHELHSIVD